MPEMNAQDVLGKLQADVEMLEELLLDPEQRSDPENWDTLELSLRSSADAIGRLADARADCWCPGWTGNALVSSKPR